MSSSLKTATIFGVVLLCIGGVFLLPPMAQDPQYHHFADGRRILGVPNFWNVVSNLPFILIGLMGLLKLGRGSMPGYLLEIRPVYFIFFVGVVLTGVGSAYYHIDPTNRTLVWDRLAMTVLFMAFFSTIWAEHVSVVMAGKMVGPLIAVGLTSVLYWHVTEVQGHGDLRFYALVQYLPLALLPLVMVLFKSTMAPVGYVWGLMAAYGAAKLLEMLDGPLYWVCKGLSGHTLKHGVAAAGLFIYYLAGTRRHIR